MNSIFAALLQKRRWVLLTASLLFLAAGIQVKNLKIILDADKLLPPTHEYTVGSRAITSTFGLKYTIVAAFTKTDQTDWNQTDLDALQGITRAVSGVEGVLRATVTSLTSEKVKRLEGSADSLQGRAFYSRGKDLHDIEKVINADSFFKGLLINPTAKTLYVLLDCETPNKGFRELTGRIRTELTASPQFRVATTGFVPMMAAIEDYSDRVAMLLTGAMGIIGLLLYFRTGSVQGAILPLATGLIAVIFTLGIMGAAGVPIDVFNAITPILIFAVIAGHSTQILSTYTNNLKADGLTTVDQPTAHRYLASTMAELAPVLLAAGLAAAGGFWSLMVFDIQSIWTFGLMAGTAIAIGVVLELTVVPALRASLKPPKLDKPDARLSRLLDGLATSASQLVLQRTALCLVLFAALLAVSVYLSSKVQVENSNKANIALSEPIQKDDQFINAEFPGTNTLYVMVDSGKPDGVKDPAFIQALDKLAKSPLSDPSVGRTISYADHVSRLHAAVFPDDKQPLPAQRDQLIDEINLYEISSSPKDFSQFVDPDFRYASIIVLMKDDAYSSMKRVAHAVEKAHSTFAPQTKIQFGGSVAEAAAITEQLVHDKLWNMAQVLAVVLVIAFITFRSIAYALLVVLPLVLSVFVNFGLMGLLGIPLNIPTALCAAMVVGLGADYAIYFLMKYRRLLHSGLDVDQALHGAIASAGSICLGVAVLIALGYSVLILSYSFLPHRWIGMLVVCAMLVSAIATVTLVPALLRLFSRKPQEVAA